MGILKNNGGRGNYIEICTDSVINLGGGPGSKTGE